MLGFTQLVDNMEGSSLKFVGSSSGWCGEKVEFSAEEEDASAVVGEVSESSCGGFQGLDKGVEAFGGAVADAVAEPGEDVGQVVLDHLGGLLDRWQLAAASPLIPLREKLVRVACVGVFPEPAELFADGPRSGGLELRLFQRFELQPFVVAQVLRIEEPKLFGPCECLVSILLQGFVFLTSNLVDGLIEVLADVEPVMHDFGLRGVLLDTVLEGFPHVDRHRFDVLFLLGREGLPEFASGRFVAALADCQHAMPINVRHHADVVMAFAETLLVDSQMSDLLQIPTSQASLHSPIQDELYAREMQSRD